MNEPTRRACKENEERCLLLVLLSVGAMIGLVVGTFDCTLPPSHACTAAIISVFTFGLGGVGALGRAAMWQRRRQEAERREANMPGGADEVCQIHEAKISEQARNSTESRA